MSSASSVIAPGGVIAIVRLSVPPPDEVIDAVAAGGVRAIEVTANTPRAFDIVAHWHGRDATVVGVGTVRTAKDARRAIEAGAQFLVTPTLMPEVLLEARAAEVPVVCGALSPTEIDIAWQHGAAAVKVFPVDSVGGPRYIKAVQAPLNDVALVPTGGVTPTVAQEYASLRCAGVGVGSALIAPEIVNAGSWELLTQRAAAFTAAWSAGGRR